MSGSFHMAQSLSRPLKCSESASPSGLWPRTPHLKINTVPASIQTISAPSATSRATGLNVRLRIALPPFTTRLPSNPLASAFRKFPPASRTSVPAKT